MRLQFVAHALKLLESLGELVGHLGNLHRRTYACNHVLALCIGQELSEEALFACGRVTGKGNACTAVVAHVSECHGLYVYGRTPGIRNVIVPAVYVCTGVVPGTEHSLDCAHQLLLGIIGEVAADLCLILGLELSCQFLQILCGKLHVLCYALLLLHGVDKLLEILLAHFHNNVGVHLDKSSVAVPCPAGIIGLLGDNIYHVLVQTQVQDGVHHAGHGSSCAGTDGYKQGILMVTEFLAGDLFHLNDVLINLRLYFIIDLSSVLVILRTGLRRNRKALRHRESQTCHLCQIRTLAAQKLTHVRVALCKQVHPFSHVLFFLSI